MFATLALICSTLSVTAAASVNSNNYNTDNLVALVQIFRHGERTPISFYPNDPWKHEKFWTLETGQLTKTGKTMHYDLGQFTRRRYKKFLPKFYYRSWFQAQTTDVDRTHMSCQSNLAAMFQPIGNETLKRDMPWQPIPVHIAEGKLTTAFIGCPVYQTELAKVVLRDPLFAKLNKKVSNVYAYISKHSGEKVTSVLQVSSIYDALYVEDRLGYELPPWTNAVYPEPMRSLNGYAFKANSFTTRMKRLSAGTWLKSAIYDHFSSFFNGTHPSKIFQMWSAHDINIACILNTLGAFNVVRQPALASTMYFELRNNSGSPYINIYYKDDDQGIFNPVTISGCSFNCSLNDFKTALADYLIDINTWTTECEEEIVEEPQEEGEEGVWLEDRAEAESKSQIAETKEYVKVFIQQRYQ